MRTRLFRVLVTAGALLLAMSPVFAHHWFPGASDKPVRMVGTVTSFVWVNPHARFYLDVKDETGKVTNWEIELGGPAALVLRGWSRDSVKPGDVITVDAFPWKGLTNMAVARTIRFPDGREVFAGSHAGDVPTRVR